MRLTVLEHGMRGLSLSTMAWHEQMKIKIEHCCLVYQNEELNVTCSISYYVSHF